MVNRAGGMFFGAVIDRDNAIAQGKPVETETRFCSDPFAMMAAAIQVPPQA